MVGKVWTFRRGDTEPQRLQLERRSSGQWIAVDLTGATVRFLLAAVDTATPYEGTATVASPPTAGQVDLVPGATVPAGEYDAEVEVTYAGGTKQTFPTTGPITVRIVEDLG